MTQGRKKRTKDLAHCKSIDLASYLESTSIINGDKMSTNESKYSNKGDYP